MGSCFFFSGLACGVYPHASCQPDLILPLIISYLIFLSHAGKIYWTDLGTWSSAQGKYINGKIQRSNMDGSNVQDVVTGLDRPQAMALDASAGQ